MQKPGVCLQSAEILARSAERGRRNLKVFRDYEQACNNLDTQSRPVENCKRLDMQKPVQICLQTWFTENLEQVFRNMEQLAETWSRPAENQTRACRELEELCGDLQKAFKDCKQVFRNLKRPLKGFSEGMSYNLGKACRDTEKPAEACRGLIKACRDLEKVVCRDMGQPKQVCRKICSFQNVLSDVVWHEFL